MENRENSINYSAVVVTEKEGYDASVIKRMSERNGVTPKGAKGIALEIKFTDKENAKTIFDVNKHTQLTKKATAPQVDIVTMDKNKVIKRYQAKDITSKSGIDKTIKQVEAGKYRQTQLIGTTETAEVFNKEAFDKGLSKRMKDTGISTKETSRVSEKFIASKTGTMAPNLGKNAFYAGKNTAKGSVFTTAFVEAGKAIINGDDFETGIKNVTTHTAENAVSGFTAGALSEVAFLGTAAICPPAALPVAVVTGITTAIAAGEVMDGVFDDVVEEIGTAVEKGSETVQKLASDAIDNFERKTLERFDRAEKAIDTVFDGAMEAARVLDDIGESISSSISGFFSKWW